MTLARPAPPRRADESADEYQRFVSWLLSDPRPPIPEPQIAARYDWLGRALQHQNHQPVHVHAAPPATSADLTQKILQLANLETEKYLTLSLSQPDAPIFSPAELFRLLAVLRGGGPVAATPQDPRAHLGLDYSSLSDDELDALTQIAERLLPP